MLGALWTPENFRNFVYGKKVILLTDHKALHPFLKRNRAQKQYSARLTRWLGRLGHFDVNAQYTAGKNNPLTDYLSRLPISYNDETEAEQESGEHGETNRRAVRINKFYGLFDFNRTNGSITQYIGQSSSARKTDQSQRNTTYA